MLLYSAHFACWKKVLICTYVLFTLKLNLSIKQMFNFITLAVLQYTLYRLLIIKDMHAYVCEYITKMNVPVCILFMITNS